MHSDFRKSDDKKISSILADCSSFGLIFKVCSFELIAQLPAEIDVQNGDKLQLVGHSLGVDLLIPKTTICVGDENRQLCVCPHCRRTIHASVDTSRSKPRRAPPVLVDGANAYAALMYGCAPAYFVGALVTGWSLSRYSSFPKSCRILLCTSDVPKTFRSVLSEVWTIKSVEYIENASSCFYWDYYNSRFKQVFTKLRIFDDMISFKKVVLLDLDLLIRREIDSLFDLPAPAAMVRGQCSLNHGEEVEMDTFYFGHRQVLGINCGVMLVEPNQTLFKQMMKEVRDHRHPEHWPSHGPEQDYLSRFYNAFGKWTNLSCRYNYQVHLTLYGSLEWHHYNRRNHPDVSVFHFSGKLVKPWEFVLDLHIAHGMTFNEIETFVRGLYDKALNSMKDRIDGIVTTTSFNKTKELSKSHFCHGILSHQYGSRRCYLDRYIHASWSEADSEAVIEWLHAFQEADEGIGYAMTQVLTQDWNEEEQEI